jgi:UDP-N-acetylglucosamine/UDP-N-acetylgalactosamine diphosphorylase
LTFWHELQPDQRKSLLTQIYDLDLDQVDTWITHYVKNNQPTEVPSNFTPAPYYPHIPPSDNMSLKYKKAIDLGISSMKHGKIGAFLVSGGQGTRLGFNGPKGNFPISPIKNKTLFRLFAENIAAHSKQSGHPIPWYVMTSPLNYQQTIDIFDANDYFELGKENVFIFQQGTFPNFDFNGKILLADKDTIACSPDGHGGSLKAIYDSGAVDDMKQRGIEYLSYWQVDNPLVNIFDPLFMGLHILDHSDMSSKAVKKIDAFEKMGVLSLINGKVSVIEYSDLSDELATLKKPDGSLVFEMGSIGIHIISRSFIEKLNKESFSLPIHKAVKKIPYIDSHGHLITPYEPNGIKLETFIFDALPLAENSIILETQRSQEFAPIKNASGTDSPESSKQMMINRAAQWLERAGIAIPYKTDGIPDCIIEIAPSFALSEQDVKDKHLQVPVIKPGDSIYLA